MRSRVRFLVKGQVQGIGYRFFVLEIAQRLRLEGWVRNLADGDVEGEAEGEADALEDLFRELKSGHRWAEVERIETRTIPPLRDPEGLFRITR